jgi:hypothetical protein
MFIGLYVILLDAHILGAASLTIAFGASLMFWGVFSLLLWMYARKAAFTLNMTFLCLWITYFFLGLGNITGIAVLGMIGGYVGIVCAFFAALTAFNIIMASAPKK